MDIRSSIEQMISERIEQLAGERTSDMIEREKVLFDFMEELADRDGNGGKEDFIQQTEWFTDCLAENNRYYYIAGLKDSIRIMKILCKL